MKISGLHQTGDKVFDFWVQSLQFKNGIQLIEDMILTGVFTPDMLKEHYRKSTALEAAAEDLLAHARETSRPGADSIQER